MDLKIIYIFLILPVLASCNGYLEPESMTELTRNQATRDYDYSKSRVASIYSDIRSGFSVIGEAMLASACDEALATVGLADTGSKRAGRFSMAPNWLP